MTKAEANDGAQAALQRRGRPGAGRPSAENAERKRLALIDAALTEFATCGFNGASLRVIAEKASVSTRTLFNHYPDKTALFAACIEHSSRMTQQVVTTLRRPTLAETLVAYGVAMQEQLSANVSRQIAMLIYREGFAFDDIRMIARTQFATYQVEPVVQILRDFGYAQDDIRDVAVQFVSMAFGAWQRSLLFGEPTPDAAETLRHMSVVTRILLCGIEQGEPSANASSANGGNFSL